MTSFVCQVQLRKWLWPQLLERFRCKWLFWPDNLETRDLMPSLRTHTALGLDSGCTPESCAVVEVSHSAPNPQRFQLRCRGWGTGIFSTRLGDSQRQPGLTPAGASPCSSAASLPHRSLSHIYLWPAFFLSAKCWSNSFACPLLECF